MKGCNAPYGDSLMMPDLDFTINCTLWGSPHAGWNDWQYLRGGGFRSFVKWLVTTGAITDHEDDCDLQHRRLTEKGRCHRWRGHDFHFCHIGELMEFDKRVGVTAV